MGAIHYGGRIYGVDDATAFALRHLVEHITSAGAYECVPVDGHDPTTDTAVTVWMLVGPGIAIAFDLPHNDDMTADHLERLTQQYLPPSLD